MKLHELAQTLIDRCIDPNAYDLGGIGQSDQYVLRQEKGGWVVYCCSRDKRLDEIIFSNEDEACSYFLEKVSRDPTIIIR